MTRAMLFLLCSLFAVSSALALVTRARLGRWTLIFPAAATAATFVAVGFRRPAKGELLSSNTYTWVESLQVHLSLGVDGYGWLFSLIISGIGLLVLAYAAAYFDHTPNRLVGRFSSLFSLFSAAMLGVVWAQDIWTLFIAWELTSICSFLLIGLIDHHEGARSSALQALLTTGAGGLAMLAGFGLLASITGETSLDAVAAAIGTGDRRVDAALVLILVGAATKSAQVPFHYWLPGAMAAPTPVSAFLHSATMVKAGVVLVARTAPAASEVAWWTPTLIVMGGTTMLWGGARALRQVDAKLILAFGTVSQLGFLIVLFGIGDPYTTAAGVGMLLAHSVFKAALFMVVGLVDHATGTRDIRRLHGLGTTLRPLAIIAAISGASMAGVPPLLGFVSKESALAALDHLGTAWGVAALAIVSVGSILTVAYTLRFWFGTFGDTTDDAAGALAPAHHRVRWTAYGPAAILSVLTVAGGLAAPVLQRALDTAAYALDANSSMHLTLWAGANLALGLSVGVLTLGTALWLVLGRATPGPMSWPITAQSTYQGMFDTLISWSKSTTAVVQNGSLPAYLMVTFSVMTAAVLIPAALWWQLGPVEIRPADSWAQLVVAIVAAVLGIAIVATRRRFAAVLLLGGVGYSLSLLYLFLGAPDLALTQLLVETISTVMFLLVLRFLPSGYAPAPQWAPTAVRAGIAVLSGAAMTIALVLVGTANSDTPASDTITDLSYPAAAGRNVVNVILVDFRGFDTMGEITVLALGAIGVASLVRGARRTQGLDELDEYGRSTSGVGPRSVVLDTASRGLFPVMMLVAIYVTFHGHNAPGGGFAGGLIAGAAMLLRYLSAGASALRRTIRVPPLTLTAIGLLIALGTAASGLTGGDLLESGAATIGLPFVGDIKIVSSTFFDIGVFVTVIGVVLTMLVNLGSDSSDGLVASPEPTREVAP